MDYGRFLTEVQKQGCFASDREAAAAVSGVLMAVAEVLSQPQARELTSSLPPELHVYLRPAHEEPDPYFDAQLFLGWVVSTFDATGGRDKTAGGLDHYAHYSGDEAIRRCQCVFSVLKTLLDRQQQETLSDCLPDEVKSWFREA
jgi:uncharacterized protein (DUF2267 family)